MFLRRSVPVSGRTIHQANGGADDGDDARRAQSGADGRCNHGLTNSPAYAPEHLVRGHGEISLFLKTRIENTRARRSVPLEPDFSAGFTEVPSAPIRC
jgi:hypothetical protein